MAYKVDPPNWWSRQLHPVFHVSMLKPFYEDTADPSRGQIRRPGLKPKAAGKRVAEAILNDRIVEICWRTLLARGKSSPRVYIRGWDYRVYNIEKLERKGGPPGADPISWSASPQESLKSYSKVYTALEEAALRANP
ncbi:hypothetical protein RJ640_008217 [Escallonia rubra]|uniref:Uncharacterized protein n=1 Tax=Escallonia rubra TaxID=112253 RepID=A0AA88QJI0_9ASTE|nr:hypothetical protein RJ640_008217 [Escallonia rubra]